MDQKQRENIIVKVEGIGDEVLKGIHSAKSYVGVAWLTLLLYYIGFYIIGLIVNLVYLSKAKQTMKITNTSPPGRGCLRFLLWTHLLIPITFVLILFTGIGTDMIMKTIVGHRTKICVPSLENIHFNVAKEKCKNLDLYLTQIDFANSENVEKNHIISQKPSPNIMTTKYNTIEVLISSGPAKIRIPFLIDLMVPQAKLKLENAGLKLGEKIFRYSEEVVEGKVIYSQPMSDELIVKNSTVNIIVSLGKFNDSK